MTVARSQQPARPLPSDPGQQLAHLVRGDEPRFQPVRVADRLPAPVGLELARVPGNSQVAAHRELEIGVELRREVPPQRVRRHHQRQLDRVAFLLADEPPRPARLLHPDVVFL